MRRAWTLARKEFRDLLRERSVVLALLVQFFVATFSAFLTVGLVGLYDPEASDSQPNALVAYVGPGGFDAFLDDAPNLRIERPSLAEGVAGFHRGDYAAVVEETYANETTERTVTLLLPESEIQTTLLVTQFKSLLRDYERSLREDREGRIDQTLIYVDVPAHPNVYYAFIFSTLLPLLVLTPIFLSGAITGDSMNHEIQSQTLSLLRSSPLTPAELIVGKLAMPVLLVPVQVALWIGLLRFNGVHVANTIPLLTFATFVALLLSAGSILVALHVRREGQTQAAYALLVLALFVVSLLLPREPLNLVARLGSGAADAADLVAVLLYGLVAALTLVVTLLVGRRRLARNET